jgi:hypothetical protein
MTGIGVLQDARVRGRNSHRQRQSRVTRMGGL